MIAGAADGEALARASGVHAWLFLADGGIFETS